MKKRSITPIVLFIFSILLVICIPLSAVSEKKETPEETFPEEKPAETSDLATLNNLIKSMDDLGRMVNDLEKSKKRAANDEEIQKLENDARQLNEHLRALKSDFERIATGVDVDNYTAKQKKDFDWKGEIQELLNPLIQELRRMTERPRQEERLRGEIEFFEKQVPIIRKALKNIEKHLEDADTKALKKYLRALEKKWRNEEQKTESLLKVANYRFEELTKEKKSLIESTQNLLKLFFKSRGKNLVFSISTFIIVFFLFQVFHRVIYKVSPIHHYENRTFYIRLMDVVYHILTFLGSIGASLVVLYVSGDWVLLILLVIFLLGLAWAARQGVPRFWEQIKLLLNLGTVREKERVMYKGVPWMVSSLNVYSHLQNPEFGTGRIRLPLRELVGLHSRPGHPSEPWFPCKKGDWVELSDDTFGKVDLITPEMVRIILRGNSGKTIPTEDFIRMNPVNLSDGFRLRVTFGIDYGHQEISTSEIPEKLQEMLKEKLAEAEFGKSLVSLSVQFKEAGASSLDLMVLADFHGSAAEGKRRLQRMIQRICVDACNKYSWVIPFTQVTLHTADQ